MAAVAGPGDPRHGLAVHGQAGQATEQVQPDLQNKYDFLRCSEV
jgi:hypothetical protein